CLFCWSGCPVYDHESEFHHHRLDVRQQQSQQRSLGHSVFKQLFSVVLCVCVCV
ncbi:Fumarate reductase iron-sulfur subunit, partial [Clarias magur]